MFEKKEKEKCVQFNIPLSYYRAMIHVLEGLEMTDMVFARRDEGGVQVEVMFAPDKLTIAGTADGESGKKVICNVNGVTEVETFTPAFRSGSDYMLTFMKDSE